MNTVIFLRTAWMVKYKGVTPNDQPDGAGSYVTANRDGGEVLNFLPIKGKFYGFARIKKGNSLRIQRLGATKSADFVDKITVVFFATDPISGGQYVVGWYDNAILYRKVQKLPLNFRKGYDFYMVSTDKKNARLLPVDLRNFRIPSDGPGQTNAWYVMEYASAESYLKEFWKFKKDPENYRKTKASKGNSSGWQIDAEKRKQTEIAAMKATELSFIKKGFTVKYVHKENLGWDMEATKGKQTLVLEVKGSCNAIESVLLTPNEYVNSLQLKNYRICILEKALEARNAKLHICRLSLNKRSWITQFGEMLKIKEIKSAKLLYQPTSKV